MFLDKTDPAHLPVPRMIPRYEEVMIGLEERRTGEVMASVLLMNHMQKVCLLQAVLKCYVNCVPGHN